MRLDKYIATVSNLSRSDAKRLLKAGRVLVAGSAVTDPRFDVPATAAVAIDGELLRAATPRYFMLNKPEGYISATKDRQHQTVLDLLDEDNTDQLHIAGRLDIDTTGLVLITDDGQWSHRITSPTSGCQKTYLLETAEPITETQKQQIELGIKLDNEKRPTLPAKMELVASHIARLTITEGKYHQVKRMLSAVGNHIEVLHRERIGAISLDEELLSGDYRALTEQEIDSV